MYEQILLRRQYLNSEIEKCLKVIKNSPEGKFYIAQNGKYTKWYISMPDESRKYLSKKEIKTAQLMARKRFHQEYLEELLKETNAIDFYLSHCPKPESSFKMSEKSIPYHSLNKSLYLSENDKGLIWQNTPYDTNPYLPEEKTHDSPTGRNFRSKSEVFIDMELASLHIPNRYECKLVINGEHMYPDFTILKVSTGELRYWEHFGKMDDPNYARKTYRKIDEYISAGFFPGENLICTFETKNHPLPYRNIQKEANYIRNWIES